MKNNFKIVPLDVDYSFGSESEANDSVQESGKKAKLLSAVDALIESVNKLGGIDMYYICRLSGKFVDEIILELADRGIIFQDPEYFKNRETYDCMVGWVLRSQYLCGKIQNKLKIAKEMNEKFPNAFNRNIEELKIIAPVSLTIDDISIALGANWLTPSIHSLFIKELLNLSENPVVKYNKLLATWEIEESEEAKYSILNNFTFGTSRLSAIKIIKNTMNARTVKVYDSVYNPYSSSYDCMDRVLNSDATLAAQEKQNIIIEEFISWVKSDKQRAKYVESLYNDALVGFTFSPYNGDFLKFADMNPEITLYKHQKDAIARILLSRENVLLAHNVGAGKTYEIVAGVHELKRTGLSEKNLVVVPNQVLQAAVDCHRLLYPQDEIKVIYPSKFGPKNRDNELEDIANGDYTAIYIPFSSFDKIHMSKEYWINAKQDEINRLRSAILHATNTHDTYRLTAKVKSLSKALKKYIAEEVETPWLCYDSLGITCIVIDEVQNYKNVPVRSRSDNIVGMHTAKNTKCSEALAKVQSTPRAIFSTGTPLTNSLADLFVLQTYLQPTDLKFNDIDTFDMWLNCFGERRSSIEVDVDSSNLRPMTRFSSFHNLSELMAMFSCVCDYHNTRESDTELPKFEGETNIVVKRSEEQEEYMNDLVTRAELIRARKVKRSEDNMLKVTIDGILCAVDYQLVDPEYTVSTHPKIEACAKKTAELYEKYPGTCQVIFSDVGVPKAGVFNVYDCLRDALVSQGIPSAEIAYVHSAVNEKERTKMFAAVNSGKIRVIIGSTAKLGVGVNIQEKLVACHHLSVPFRPSDMVQRLGRIHRRGNTCEEIFVFRYVTEGSFDSYMYQINENKQRFISSFLAGVSDEREMEDIADTVLTYAEVKTLALGDSRIKKRFEIANNLEREKIAGRQRRKQLIELRSVIDSTPAKITELDALSERTKKDIELYKQNKESIPNDERIQFGEDLIYALKANANEPSERYFWSYQGFDVMLPARMNSERPYVNIRSSNGGCYQVDMKTDKVRGISSRIDYMLDHLPDRIATIEKQRQLTIQRCNEAEEDYAQGNKHDENTDRLAAELKAIDREIENEETE